MTNTEQGQSTHWLTNPSAAWIVYTAHWFATEEEARVYVATVASGPREVQLVGGTESNPNEHRFGSK